MLELAGIDFKAAILNISKYLNEKMETITETNDLVWEFIPFAS